MGKHQRRRVRDQAADQEQTERLATADDLAESPERRDVTVTAAVAVASGVTGTGQLPPDEDNEG